MDHSEGIILDKLNERLKKYWKDAAAGKGKVVNYQSPDKLKKLLDLKIGKEGKEADWILEATEDILKYSVNTLHSRFNNQLYTHTNFPAFAGEVLTAITNTSMATYEVAPLATLMEDELVNTLNELFGIRTPDNRAEGIMVTGGSNSNMIAMMMARNEEVEKARSKGLHGPNYKVFVSDESHYSFTKAANILGIGRDNVVRVAIDDRGKMIPQALEEAILAAKAKGEVPIMVGATAGTTVLGAFDPLSEIARICEEHELWFHVDGAWGGAAILSNKHRHLLDGVERADSIAFDAHKVMGIPLISSFFLCRHRGKMQKHLGGGGEEYLFHDDDNDNWDTGSQSLQCGRRVDSLKTWMAWKYLGRDGYERQLDQCMELAAYMEKQVVDHEQFELILEPEFLNVCFRLRLTGEFENFSGINLRIRDHLAKSGKHLTNYSTIYNGKLFFRFIVINPDLKKKHIDEFLETVLEVGRELSQQPKHA